MFFRSGRAQPSPYARPSNTAESKICHQFLFAKCKRLQRVQSEPPCAVQSACFPSFTTPVHWCVARIFTTATQATPYHPIIPLFSRLRHNQRLDIRFVRYPQPPSASRSLLERALIVIRRFRFHFRGRSVDYIQSQIIGYQFHTTSLKLSQIFVFPQWQPYRRAGRPPT